MKKEITEYTVRWLECQKVKFEHRHPTGLLQPLYTIIKMGSSQYGFYHEFTYDKVTT